MTSLEEKIDRLAAWQESHQEFDDKFQAQIIKEQHDVKKALEKSNDITSEYHVTLKERNDFRDKKMDDFIDTMQPLTDLANSFKGIGLLKKPSLWLLAFVLGVVAFLGGIKSLFGILASIVMNK